MSVAADRRPAGSRAAAAVALLGAWTWPLEVQADACPPAVATWVDGCARGEALVVTRTACADSVAMVDVATPAGPLRIELSGGGGRGFVRRGRVGLSPVGDFADWDAEPRPLRDALSGLARCAERDGSVADALGEVVTAPRHDEPPATRPPPRPVRWLVGLALGVLACAAAARRGTRRGVPGEALGVLALAVAAFVLRRAVVPVGFLHQNGQGPLWVAEALPSARAGWPYGPGFAEVFALATGLSHDDPDGALFLAQGALGAAAVVATWVVARRASANGAVAWAFAALVALDPCLARLSQSESYFGVAASLLLVAGAFVSLGVSAGQSPVWRRAAALAGAGLLVAQVARVHPIAWVPAATLPLVAVAGPGRRGPLVRDALLATAVLAAFTVLAAGAALLEVLRGPLGGQWLGVAGAHVGVSARLGAAFAAVGLLLSTQRARAVRAVGVGAAAFAASLATNLVSGHTAWVDAATLRLFAPAAVAAAASLVTAVRLPRRVRRPAAALLLALAGTWMASSLRQYRVLPTDVLEAAWAREWRRELVELPVAYLSRAGQRLAILPLHPDVRGRVEALVADDPAEMRVPGGDFLYYRSSLCSTPDGRPACEALEASLELALVEARELPARASMRGLDYDRDLVRVGLYRARSRR